jgi:hypothetical protein
VLLLLFLLLLLLLSRFCLVTDSDAAPSVRSSRKLNMQAAIGNCRQMPTSIKSRSALSDHLSPLVKNHTIPIAGPRMPGIT